MSDLFKCVHCGAETKHPVVKEIGGEKLNFCCYGCLQVYEFLQEEGLLAQVRAEEETATRSRERGWG
jgi:hypothetical protein